MKKEGPELQGPKPVGETIRIWLIFSNVCVCRTAETHCDAVVEISAMVSSTMMTLVVIAMEFAPTAIAGFAHQPLAVDQLQHVEQHEGQ